MKHVKPLYSDFNLFCYFGLGVLNQIDVFFIPCFPKVTATFQGMIWSSEQKP